MNNRLADQILRVAGWVNGVRPLEWVSRFENMQWWGAGRIREWQASELSGILRFARSHVPLYEQRFPARVGDQGAGESAGLVDIPVLTKDVVREKFQEIQSRSISRRGRQDISTSGSTGKPLKIAVDNEAFGRYFAAKFRALRWYGVDFADRQLRVWGLMLAADKRLYWKVRDLLQNRIRLVSFDLSDRALQECYEKCLRFQPTYINGYTSAVDRFAAFIEEKGLDGTALGVKLVVPTAEMLYEWQAERMARVFGCPVMNEYGGAEVQAIAYQCPAGRMHVSHENVIAEVLDEGGSPVGDGELGFLTVTSLCATGMPMIRYQNGDLVELEPEMWCPCGRHPGLPGIRRIIGRSTDVLFRTDGQPTHWTTMYYAIKDAFDPGMVLEHQAIQKALDHLLILVVKGPRYSDDAMERFLGRLRDILGDEIRLELQFVPEIRREGSGKHRYFVSELEQGICRPSGSV